MATTLLRGRHTPSSNRRTPDHSVSCPRARRRGTWLRAGAAVLLLAGCDASVPTPASDLSSGQALIDLNAQLAQFREDNALLQAQIDSLRAVVAYQDTVLRQVAAGAGVSVRPPVRPIP